MGGGFVFGGGDGDHDAAGGEAGHELGAGGDQGAGVGQGQDSCGVGGGDLADGVPGEPVRVQAEAGEQGVQGALVGEQGGLGVAGVVQQCCLGGASGCEHDRAQGLVQVRVQVLAGLVQGVGEDGERRVQAGAHPGPLRTLPRKQERHLAVSDNAKRNVMDLLSLGQRIQAAEEAGTIRRRDHGTVAEVRPGRGQRVTDVR